MTTEYMEAVYSSVIRFSTMHSGSCPPTKGQPSILAVADEAIE
jgi:hypothetical protein